tara:strand:+ start:1174 stop:2109 length:936 start_codon:yes stop_codon:yes gene_type:complete
VSLNYKLKNLLYFLLKNKKFKVLFKFFEKILHPYFKKKNLKFLLSSKLFNFIQMFSKGKVFFLIKQKRNEFFLNEKKDNQKDIILENLFEKGYSEILDINNKKIIETQEYFKSKKIFNAHVPFDSNKKITYEQFLNDENLNYGSYDIRTSFECPLINEIIFDKKILNIVSRYLLTTKFYCYHINTMITKQSKILNPVTDFHRDYDSANSLTLFLLLTNVSENDGATQIIEGSHKLEACDENGNNKKIFLKGNAGKIYAVDTWSLHSGNKKLEKIRLVSWIRFSSFSARSYYQEKNYLFDDVFKKLRFNLNE